MLCKNQLVREQGNDFWTITEGMSRMSLCLNFETARWTMFSVLQKVRFPFFCQFVKRNRVLYKACQRNKTTGVSSRNYTRGITQWRKYEIMHTNLRFRVCLDFSIGWESWFLEILRISLLGQILLLDICIKAPASTTECLLLWFWLASKLRNFEFLEKGWNVVLLVFWYYFRRTFRIWDEIIRWLLVGRITTVKSTEEQEKSDQTLKKKAQNIVKVVPERRWVLSAYI